MCELVFLPTKECSEETCGVVLEARAILQREWRGLGGEGSGGEGSGGRGLGGGSALYAEVCVL